jgi:hypothetical protein
MSTKKRKPLLPREKSLSSVQRKRKLHHHQHSYVVSPAPQASQEAEIPPTPITPFALLPTAKPPQPFASTPEPVPIQSKMPSLMSKLQAPDKEATVRFTVDMSETLHRKLLMLAARTGRKKVDPSADVAGGWVEGDGGVRILSILMA